MGCAASKPTADPRSAFLDHEVRSTSKHRVRPRCPKRWQQRLRAFLSLSGSGRAPGVMEPGRPKKRRNLRARVQALTRCCVPAGAGLPSPMACKGVTVDIGPNLEVWPCFPLSAETFRLEQFRTLAEAQAFFSDWGATEPLLYEGNCATCEERLNKACDAGCRGFQIVRRASVRPAERLPNATLLRAHG